MFFLMPLDVLLQLASRGQCVTTSQLVFLSCRFFFYIQNSQKDLRISTVLFFYSCFCLIVFSCFGNNRFFCPSSYFLLPRRSDFPFIHASCLHRCHSSSSPIVLRRLFRFFSPSLLFSIPPHLQIPPHSFSSLPCCSHSISHFLLCSFILFLQSTFWVCPL